MGPIDFGIIFFEFKHKKGLVLKFFDQGKIFG